MLNQVFSIRGATTVDENTPEEITRQSVELMQKIIESNDLYRPEVEITDYIVGTTADITAFYPARAIRESGVTAPVFSVTEPPIDGALPLCIRLLVRVANYGNEIITPKHVYLRGAQKLRRDLMSSTEDDK